MKKRSKLLLSIVGLLFVIQILFLSYMIISESEKTMNNYHIFKKIMVVYIVLYFVVFSYYIKKIIKETKTYSLFFIYGQLYNLLAFLVGIIFIYNVRFDIKHFISLNLSDKIVNILFFPGSYFIEYFDCVQHGWSCIGASFGTTIIFNTIIFTTLGFILGIILESIKKKK